MWLRVLASLLLLAVVALPVIAQGTASGLEGRFSWALSFFS